MVEVRSRLDKGLTTPLLRLTLRRILWLFLSFSLLFIALGVITIVGRVDEDSLSGGIALIAFGVLFLPLFFLLVFGLQRLANKTMPLMGAETLNTFWFDQYKIYQEQLRGTEYRATVESSYTLLYKAYETRSHFFLYISNAQVHIVPKKDIVSGSPEELAGYFTLHLQKKFKKYNIK